MLLSGLKQMVGIWLIWKEIIDNISIQQGKVVSPSRDILVKKSLQVP